MYLLKYKYAIVGLKLKIILNIFNLKKYNDQVK